MAATLAEGLHFIHDRGVVHRDVKPANVLLAPSPIPGRPPVAKLSDFGIARLVESDRVTSTGTFVGTAQYLSPEQARGEPVGPPSDIYSLGLTLLEAVTGATSFPGSAIESATARLARDPVVPGSLGYGWKSLLTAMTNRNPAARPTALDVVLRAQALLAGDVEEGPTEPAGVATTPVPAAAPVRAVARRAEELPHAPAAAPADESAAATRVLPLDHRLDEPFDDIIDEPRGAAATSVLRAVVEPGRGALEWLRQRPALALGLAALAAVLLALVLLVALMPGAPSPETAPPLPTTGEPLHTHLQRLLESVSR
jgi:hypothetical protein